MKGSEPEGKALLVDLEVIKKARRVLCSEGRGKFGSKARRGADLQVELWISYLL